MEAHLLPRPLLSRADCLLSPLMPSLFPEPPQPHVPPLRTDPSATLHAHCDGGARGNPGPAGYGAVIVDDAGHTVAELSEFLGVRTNNYAEYAGLLASLQWTLDNGFRRLSVVSDSKLMVMQIEGRFQVKSPDLKPLWSEARRRIQQLEAFEISHALRHKNKVADRLANEAMDRGMGRGADRDRHRTRPAGSSPNGMSAANTKAIPYPAPGSAPPAPPHPDPAFPTGPLQASLLQAAPHQAAPLQASPRPAALPTASGSASPMLRGFTRDGTVHLLGGARLPDGIFVKVIPE